MSTIYKKQLLMGASFVHVTLNNAAATTLIPVASNTDGMMLRHLSMQVGGGGVTAAVFVGTVAPVALADLTLRRIYVQGGSTYADPGYEFPVWVPAGQGVFAWCNGAANHLCIGYDLG